MMDFWGVPNFDGLYQRFITGSTGGKIFIMKNLEREETFLGKGATVILEKANPYMLAFLKEQYIKDKDSMIGDVDLLIKRIDVNNKQQIEVYNEERLKNIVKAPKRQKQLYSIIRKHKSLRPLKFRMKLKKKEEK